MHQTELTSQELFAQALQDQKAGRLAQAEERCRRVLQLQPRHAGALQILAHLAFQCQKNDLAERLMRQAVALAPLEPTCHNNLGTVLEAQGLLDEAIACFRRATELQKDCADAHRNLGTALLSNGVPEAAMASFRQALALAPRSAAAWNEMGIALRSLGQFDQASECFRRAVTIDPNKPLYYKNLAGIGRQQAEPSNVGHLGRLLDRADLSLDDRASAGFALGKVFEDCEQFDEAFAAYSKANALFKEARAREGRAYEVGKVQQVVSAIIETLTRGFFSRRLDWGDPSVVPVFVVGMPRSGTTLVEQIAASHGLVFGAGELLEIERLHSRLPGGRSPSSAQSWDRQSIAGAAREYLAHLLNLRGVGLEMMRIIDKMPDNVWYLGLIAAMFPNARVILCRRDGRDNCLSCFFQQFSTRRAHLYSYDLADCARHYLLVRRLMDHWLEVLPLRMLEIRYEALVADQEGQSRRLLEFLGVPWDPACLEFHRTQRAVATASVWQVRQPMYRGAVGRWRHFQGQLGPMLGILSQVAA